MRVDLRAADQLVKTKRKRVPGAQLKAAREKAEKSQEALAGDLGVRVATISERENSPTGVSWETWIAWAFACGLPLEWKSPTAGDQ